jgi:hypothetical protein
VALFVVIFSVAWTVVVSTIGVRTQLRSARRLGPVPLRPGTVDGAPTPTIAEEAERWLRLQADR